MFKNRIGYKLTAGYVMIVLVSLLIVGIFFIYIFRSYTFENREKNMLNKAREIAKVTEPYLFNNAESDKYGDFIGLLDSFVNARVRVTDKNGEIIVMSRGALCVEKQYESCKDDKFGVELTEKGLKGEEAKKEGYSSYYKEPVLAVGVPVYDSSNAVIGTVSLYTPVTGITATIDTVFNVLVFAIIGAVLITGVLSILYSRFITKPLVAMNNCAIEMTKGNYSIRANVSQKDEIGQLATSLDLLASKLGYTIGQLTLEQGKLKDLIASISEGILAFDSSMKLINHNEALKRLFEYNRNDDVNDLVLKDLQEMEVWDAFKNVVEDGESRVIIHDWNIRKLKFTISPVKSNHGEIIGAVSLIQDISESERLEQMRREFVANVSHEFRTPLTVIQGSVEALMDGAVVGENYISKFHKRILNETKALQRLVNDLLDLGRLQTRKINLQLERIDIIELLQDVAQGLQTIADNKYISVDLDLRPDIPSVLGDYDRLRQLFIIFLDNAIKYSPINSKVNISFDIKDYIYIKITDNGIGIPKEDIPFIWDRFYKVDKSRQQSDNGTGLGLAIAKYIIELHHGVVSLSSELNKGTVVEVGLPLYDQNKEEQGGFT